MGKRGPFVPTHRLRDAVHSLPAGTLLRQINPFADGRRDHRWFLDEGDWNRGSRDPWILVEDEVEPLEAWPAIRQQMIDEIADRAGWNR